MAKEVLEGKGIVRNYVLFADYNITDKRGGNK